MSKEHKEKILVIKLSALGDFIQALGAMKAIREHHPNAHITLMTTPPFKSYAQHSSYFDEIWDHNTRPKALKIKDWISLRKKLINGGFSRIYDLQNNDRTNLYFNLFPKRHRPEWVGAAKGASHENSDPSRTAGHAFDGHKQTLKRAGIQNITIDKMQWIDADISAFNTKQPFVLLVPGCAPQHPQKRWPAQHYAKLAQALSQKGYQPVLIGTRAEQEVNEEISKICPECLNLTEKTDLFQITALAHHALAAIGNDTGPMHIIGVTACPTIALFSGHSAPIRHAPLGDKVITIQEENIKEITVETVIKTLEKILC